MNSITYKINKCNLVLTKLDISLFDQIFATLILKFTAKFTLKHSLKLTLPMPFKFT